LSESLTKGRSRGADAGEDRGNGGFSTFKIGRGITNKNISANDDAKLSDRETNLSSWAIMTGRGKAGASGKQWVGATRDGGEKSSRVDLLMRLRG